MGLGSEKSVPVTISTTLFSVLLEYSKSTSREANTIQCK